MLTIYRWKPADRAGAWLPADQLPDFGGKPPHDTDIWWIDLQAPTDAEERQVFANFLHVHLLTLEDITKQRREPAELPHFPKVEEFPDYLFVVINPLSGLPSEGEPPPAHAGKRPLTRQLSAVFTRNILITHHYEPLDSVNQLRVYLEKHCQQVERGPDFLFHLILDATVDEYAPTLDRITDRLDEVEDEVFGKPSPELLGHLLRLKRDIIAIRKTLILEREVLARLTRGEFTLIEPREIAYYRNVYDHLVRYSELIEGAREMVTDLMQTHLAAVSNKLNQIMKALTTVSTIILPMSLIAGIYGMNFEKPIPGYKWEPGFLTSLGLMAAVGAAAFALFKWRKWI